MIPQSKVTMTKKQNISNIGPSKVVTTCGSSGREEYLGLLCKEFNTSKNVKIINCVDYGLK